MNKRKQRIKFWKWAKRKKRFVSTEQIRIKKLWVGKKHCKWPSSFMIKFLPKGWQRCVNRDGYLWKYKGHDD